MGQRIKYIFFTFNSFLRLNLQVLTPTWKSAHADCNISDIRFMQKAALNRKKASKNLHHAQFARKACLRFKPYS